MARQHQDQQHGDEHREDYLRPDAPKTVVKARQPGRRGGVITADTLAYRADCRAPTIIRLSDRWPDALARNDGSPRRPRLRPWHRDSLQASAVIARCYLMVRLTHAFLRLPRRQEHPTLDPGLRNALIPPGGRTASTGATSRARPGRLLPSLPRTGSPYTRVAGMSLDCRANG